MPNVPKVRAGDSILKAFDHEAFNAFADAANDRNRPPSALVGESTGNGCRVWIQNNTGTDLDRYAIVGLGSPVYATSGDGLVFFLNQPLIAGALPVVATHAYRFAVLLQSIPSGWNGEALVIGVTPVQVNVTSTSHTYADVAAGITSYLTSKAAGGAKLLTTPTQTGLQWMLARVGVEPAPARNYVEYLLDKSVVGFAATGVNLLILNAANLTGWIGSTYRAGSESDVGIEYQSSETAPQTNGNFKATKDGLFRVALQGYYSLNATATPLVQNQSNVTTGPASAGTAHTHSVVQTGHDDYLLQAKPSLKINIWNKLAAGGAIALHKDAQNHFFEFQVACPPTTTERFVPIAAQWNVCLHQNDQISFKYTAAGMTNHEWTIDGDPFKLSFEYLGPIADFAAI